MVKHSGQQLLEDNKNIIDYKQEIYRQGRNLPDISCYEKGNSRPQTISFLKKLIQTYHNYTRKTELDNDEDSISYSELPHTTIHPRKNIGNCLTNSYQNTKQLLCSVSGKEMEVISIYSLQQICHHRAVPSQRNITMQQILILHS